MHLFKLFWSKKRRKQASLALLAIIVADVIWGTNVAANKVALDSIPPYIYAFVKLSIGAVALSLISFRSWVRMPLKDLVRMLFSSFIGITLFIVLLYNGQALTTASIAALILALDPLILYFFSVKLLHEKFNANLLIGSFVALAGVLMIIGYSQEGGGSLFGTLLIVVGVFLDSLGVVTKKQLIDKFPPGQIASLNFLLAVPFLGFLALFEVSDFEVTDVTTASWVALGYSTIMSAIIGFTLFYWGLRYVAVERASLFHYLIPTFGVVTSVLVLGETLTLNLVIGGALVFAGLALSEIKIPHHLHFLQKHRH